MTEYNFVKRGLYFGSSSGEFDRISEDTCTHFIFHNRVERERGREEGRKSGNNIENIQATIHEILKDEKQILDFRC